ncbi:MAG: hypothetical protein ABIP95_03420 [Pelobium sp.]
MENLNIQFTHAVTGRVQFRKDEMKNRFKISKFRSDKDFNVKISLQGLDDGDWTAFMDWEYNNQLFMLERHFTMLNENMEPL